jgi:hypothetical protein
VRIPRSQQILGGQQHNGERTLHRSQCLNKRLLKRTPPGSGNEVQHYFTVACGVENCAIALQFVPQIPGIRQIAVVRKGDRSPPAVNQDRLGIPRRTLPRSRIPDMTQGRVAVKPLQSRFAEKVRYVAHPLLNKQLFAVGTYDTCRLLTAMLQRIQSQICYAGSFRMRDNPENSAFFF